MKDLFFPKKRKSAGWRIARHPFFCIFLAFILASPTARAVETPELARFRETVLLKRVRHVMQFRAKAITKCVKRDPSDLLFRLDRSLLTVLEAKDDSSHEGLVALLGLYKATEALREEGLCEKEIDKAEAALRRKERKRFSALRLATPLLPWGAELKQIISELDPYCSLPVEENSRGALEKNPCFAGDKIVLDALLESKQDLTRSIEAAVLFINNFYSSVQNTPEGSQIELRSLGEIADAKPFLAMMALLNASNTSGGGYVDGFGDFVWRHALLEEPSPELAIAAYSKFRRTIDLYSDIVFWAQTKKLSLLVAGRFDVAAANRHDFMAAFLGCHYNSTILPRALGYAYESLDMISHLQQGVTIDSSIKNFEQDTGRYKRSSSWGVELCKAKSTF